MEPIRVLIVDDEAQLVDAVVERLRLRGFDADGVTNGHDAVKLQTKTPYDVVLLDVKMPEISGLEVIRRIKAKWPSLQVVMLTGHGSNQDAEEGIELGAFDCVMKPVNIEDLVGIIRAASAHGQDDER